MAQQQQLQLQAMTPLISQGGQLTAEKSPGTVRQLLLAMPAMVHLKQKACAAVSTVLELAACSRTATVDSPTGHTALEAEEVEEELSVLTLRRLTQQQSVLRLAAARSEAEVDLWTAAALAICPA